MVHVNAKLLSNTPSTAKLFPVLLDEFFVSPSLTARAEASAISNELPGMTRSLFSSEGIDEGGELCVGLLDNVGDVVIDGTLLGYSDGASDGELDGELDVEGDIEGLIDGSEEGASDGLLLG